MVVFVFICSYFLVFWGVGSTQAGHVNDAVEEDQGGNDAFHPKYLESLKQELQREFRRELDRQRESYNNQMAALSIKFDVEISALKDELADVKQNLADGKYEHRKDIPVSNEIYKERNNAVENELANETMTKQQHFSSVGLMNALKVPRIRSPHTRQEESESPVAFYATLSQTIQHLGSQQTVIFENEITNVGNAYDKYSGLFQAPVSGLYVFTTTLVVNNDDTAHFGFYLNNTPLTFMLLYGAQNNYDSSSNTIILQLNQGDDISVKHRDSDKGLLGSSYCMFSGFLLSRNVSQSSIVGR